MNLVEKYRIQREALRHRLNSIIREIIDNERVDEFEILVSSECYRSLIQLYENNIEFFIRHNIIRENLLEGIIFSLSVFNNELEGNGILEEDKKPILQNH